MIPMIATIASRTRFAKAYVRRIKLTIMPKRPLPNKANVVGSGARALAGLGASLEISPSSAPTNVCDLSTDVTDENVAQAVPTNNANTATTARIANRPFILFRICFIIFSVFESVFFSCSIPKTEQILCQQ